MVLMKVPLISFATMITMNAASSCSFSARLREETRTRVPQVVKKLLNKTAKRLGLKASRTNMPSREKCEEAWNNFYEEFDGFMAQGPDRRESMEDWAEMLCSEYGPPPLSIVVAYEASYQKRVIEEALAEASPTKVPESSPIIPVAIPTLVSEGLKQSPVSNNNQADMDDGDEFDESDPDLPENGPQPMTCKHAVEARMRKEARGFPFYIDPEWSDEVKALKAMFNEYLQSTSFRLLEPEPQIPIEVNVGGKVVLKLYINTRERQTRDYKISVKNLLQLAKEKHEEAVRSQVVAAEALSSGEGTSTTTTPPPLLNQSQQVEIEKTPFNSVTETTQYDENSLNPPAHLVVNSQKESSSSKLLEEGGKAISDSPSIETSKSQTENIRFAHSLDYLSNNDFSHRNSHLVKNGQSLIFSNSLDVCRGEIHNLSPGKGHSNHQNTPLLSSLIKGNVPKYNQSTKSRQFEPELQVFLKSGSFCDSVRGTSEFAINTGKLLAV